MIWYLSFISFESVNPKNSRFSVSSIFFQALNRNKKSITLDILSQEGKEVLKKLVKYSDAVCNNLRGDVPEKLGITYEKLKIFNKKIVCAHCSAYGREGSRKNWPGFDYLMQAEAGYTDSGVTNLSNTIIFFSKKFFYFF